MKINILRNADAVEDALASVNGKADSFTICRASTLQAFARDAETRLSGILPKAAWTGARVKCIPAGPSANSYKYGAKSTEVVLERGANAWFVVSVQEAKVYPRSREFCDISLTPVQSVAACLYTEKRVRAEFALSELSEDASAHERVGLELKARKLAGTMPR